MSSDDDAAARHRHRLDVRRQWDAANPDRLAAHRAKYREAHREHINELARDSSRRRRAQAKQVKVDERRAELLRERERERVRRYREANPELVASRSRTRKREWIAKQRETDITAYRAKVNAYAKAYQAGHRTELAHKAKDRRVAHPHARVEYQATYRAENHAELAQKRREDYARDPEKYLARNREWKRRERRRIKAGLPPRRPRHTTWDEMSQNDREADEFFARTRTQTEQETLAAERTTDAEAESVMQREFARARAEAGFDAMLPQLVDRRSIERARALAHDIKGHEDRERELAEEARLDAIASAINARLRLGARPHQRSADASAPHLDPGRPSTGGIEF